MRRPNILLLYTDQQRHDALGVNGNDDIQTPHLDAILQIQTIGIQIVLLMETI